MQTYIDKRHPIFIFAQFRQTDSTEIRLPARHAGGETQQNHLQAAHIPL
ncbi:hypothetical protein [Neisseria musculi]|nr:hypothetical protein [Neisseria musculi]